MKFEMVESPNIVPLFGWLVENHHHAKFGFGHSVMTQVSNADHQIRITIKEPYGCNLARQDFGHRPVKTDKDEAGDNGHSKHSYHDFHGGDAVAIDRVRVHVTVANGGEIFDAEKETIQERAWMHFCDTVAAHNVQAGKDQVDYQVAPEHQTGKLRPTEAKHPVV